MRIFLLVIVLFANLFVSGQTNETESYLWNYSSVSKAINRKNELQLGEKLHYSISDSQINYHHFDFIFYHHFNENFTLGLAVRNAYSGISENQISEVTPQIYGVYKGILKKLSVNWSNRLDYRNFETGEKQTRYRNKLTLTLLNSYTKVRIQPYLAEEMFVKFNEDGLYNVRFFGGLYLLETNYFKVDMYYCYIMLDQGVNWGHQNVKGLNLYFKI